MNDTGRSLRYDSINDATVERERKALQTAVSELLALERQLKGPVGRQAQMEATLRFPDALRAIARIDLMTDVHVRALEEQLHQLGGVTSPTIDAVRSAGATALEVLRGTPAISRDLRDDFATLGLASISYTMLQTTALGYGDGATAALAKRHHDDIAPLIAEISRIMPAIVLQELLDAGTEISPETSHRALLNTHESWQTRGL